MPHRTRTSLYPPRRSLGLEHATHHASAAPSARQTRSNQRLVSPPVERTVCFECAQARTDFVCSAVVVVVVVGRRWAWYAPLSPSSYPHTPPPPSAPSILASAHRRQDGECTDPTMANDVCREDRKRGVASPARGRMLVQVRRGTGRKVPDETGTGSVVDEAL